MGGSQSVVEDPDLALGDFHQSYPYPVPPHRWGTKHPKR